MREVELFDIVIVVPETRNIVHFIGIFGHLR